MKPLVIDLFCGRGGWSRGFLAEGYDAIGFDLERHACYPGQLVLQDVATLDGHQFRGATVIVASPPCQAYSYRAMPWKRAKALPPPSNELFEACFRIAREAQCPIVVENVRGAQPWVGRAKAHFGSYYLWGDVESIGGAIVGTRVEFGAPRLRAAVAQMDGVKVSGMNWSDRTRPAQGFNMEAIKRNGVKQHGSGAAWFDNGIAAVSSGGSARKAASAAIAEIPFELAQHIARIFKQAESQTQIVRRHESAGAKLEAPQLIVVNGGLL